MDTERDTDMDTERDTDMDTERAKSADLSGENSAQSVGAGGGGPGDVLRHLLRLVLRHLVVVRLRLAVHQRRRHHRLGKHTRPSDMRSLPRQVKSIQESVLVLVHHAFIVNGIHVPNNLLILFMVHCSNLYVVFPVFLPV